MEDQLNELRQLAAGAENRRTETGIARVAMVQGEIPQHQLAAVYDPLVNLILRGSKSMTVGGSTLHYDPATYFVMSVDLPAAGSVHPDAQGNPYLAVSLTLDPGIIVKLLVTEPDSEFFVRSLEGQPVVTSELSQTEVFSALLARERAGKITTVDRRRAWREFEQRMERMKHSSSAILEMFGINSLIHAPP
jgi:hypothetical protein